jgi:hypothetical protein
MKEIIVKALNKAKARGYDADATADLIMDYMDIADLLPQASNTLNQSIPNQPQPIASVPAAAGLISLSMEKTEDYGSTIEAPPQVNRTIAKAADPSATAWTPDALFAEAMKIDWSFEAKPAGFDQPLDYKGTPVANPRGIEGVGIVFRCPEIKTPAEIPVFLSLSEKVLDPEKIKTEVRNNVESMFRPRTKIESQFTPISRPPSDQEMVQLGTVV